MVQKIFKSKFESISAFLFNSKNLRRIVFISNSGWLATATDWWGKGHVSHHAGGQRHDRRGRRVVTALNGVHAHGGAGARKDREEVGRVAFGGGDHQEHVEVASALRDGLTMTTSCVSVAIGVGGDGLIPANHGILARASRWGGRGEVGRAYDSVGLAPGGRRRRRA